MLARMIDASVRAQPRETENYRQQAPLWRGLFFLELCSKNVHGRGHESTREATRGNDPTALHILRTPR